MLNRAAVIVGINYYEHVGPLFGCVNDASEFKRVIELNEDKSPNFECDLVTGSDATQRVTRSMLKDRIWRLFSERREVALFYFAGHGHIETTGGYLLTTECERGDDGLALGELLTLANKSPSTNRIILLDSCHSGIAGAPPLQGTSPRYRTD